MFNKKFTFFEKTLDIFYRERYNRFIGRQKMKTNGQECVNGQIERVKMGDDRAFVSVLTEYTPMLNKLISGFSNPLVSYDEAFSEASVALHRAAMTYDTENKSVTFGLYAKICVYRRLCDLYEKLAKSNNTVDFDIDKIAVYSNAETRIVGIERMREYLRHAKDILSDYEYQVLLLYIEGCSTKTIAKKLSKDTKSVENAKTRMLRALREDAEFFQDI